MFWEPQNSSLHHEGGEFLLPTVAESECTKCNQYIDKQTYKNERKGMVEYHPHAKNKTFLACLISIQKVRGRFVNVPTDFLVYQKLKRRYTVDVPNLNFCLSVFMPSPSSSSYANERELNLEFPHLYS